MVRNGTQSTVIRYTAASFGLAAALALGIAWFYRLQPQGRNIGVAQVLLALLLLSATAASSRFPIHIRVSSKVYMGSAVLFVTAVLLPPALAATTSGLGLLIGELSVKKSTGNPPAVAISQVSRWILLILAASFVAHLRILPGAGNLVPYLSAASILWVGDMLSFALVASPFTGEAPLHAVTNMVTEGGVVEASQYLVGLMGVFETSHGLWTLSLLFLPVLLVYIAFKNTKEMHDETRKIMENMADAVDLRDPYTGGHSRRVTELTAATLRQMGKHGPDVQLIVSAARVHDIGKLGIPDDVLCKQGPLSEAEWAIMEQHPEKGADLLQRYPDFARGAEIIRHHHERWDGQGYPHRLSAAEIPFGSRVIAVADSYDAMTTDRPYRSGMSATRAAAVLREGRGIQWDSQVVDAFLASISGRLSEDAQPRLRLIKPSDEPLRGTA